MRREAAAHSKVRSLLAIVATLAALGAALVKVPPAVRDGLDALREPRHPALQRELAPARALSLPRSG
jgi:hypothetical protein